uniref:Uncharacterized protein n=1 Tax=Ascaris lumbricoides TaxID=6252 RepID=A0A0M3HRS5_ASCLU
MLHGNPRSTPEKLRVRMSEQRRRGARDQVRKKMAQNHTNIYAASLGRTFQERQSSSQCGVAINRKYPLYSRLSGKDYGMTMRKG